jgi:hypothetical protein
VHSIGDFTRHGLDYAIAILASNDPDMAYGVATVEAIARLINRAMAKADTDSAGAGAGTSSEPAGHLLHMQRRFLW